MGLRATCFVLLGICSLPLLFAATGVIDLYLQNSQLDPIKSREATNIVYYGKYTIGTPAQTFLGCFDTGSGDTWVPSSSCTSSVCRSHNEYNAGASNTEKNGGTSVTIRYGTGAVALSLFYDTVNMAGISISNQGVGAASTLSADFNDVSCDGLVGLGFTALAQTGTPTPFSSMVSQGLLNSNLFSLWLSPTPGQEPAGQLNFGSIDSSKYTGSITYVPVSRQLYWEVALSGVTVGSSNAGVSASSAIVDSGTTAIVVQMADAQAIHALIPGATFWSANQIWNVTCDVSRLPSVSFVFQGITCSVPPSLYVQELMDINGVPAGVCASTITPGSSYGSAIVLGTNFLRAYYTVFTLANGNPQVGFAPGSSSASAVADGGRRRLDENNKPLFAVTAASLKQPRLGVPQTSDDPGRKLLQKLPARHTL